MIDRALLKVIEKNLTKQKVSILLGARRVGKTELLNAIYEPRKETTLWLNGEDHDVSSLLEKRSEANYKRILKSYKLLIIDEAQYIDDISRKLKLMIDTIKPLHIIITGSSAFDISQMGEPLVGRNITYHLYPLAQIEWSRQENALLTKQNLEDRLIYGNYPELSHISDVEEKSRYLKELVNTYLLKDILVFEKINNSQKLRDLLKLLAYQVSSEVSLDELGKQLSISKNTVARYLDILSKAFVIYSRSGYSGNLRKEIVKSKKWYFTDNGVRNAIINDFRPIALRQDIGALWEQYILSERIKYHEYKQKSVESYFWRTYDNQEIDLIEVESSKLSAYECKWKKGKVKPPTAFSKTYSDASFVVINQENYLDWISD
ncbi:MAG: ATP-binding protein [Bacteroidetes bacterium]|nr:ATP-binding protein [Bacteroidota bacterium]